MEISYKYISWFFIVLLAITLFGFQRYFLSFPGFNGFTYVHHIHAISLLLWFAMLFIQPVLIYAKKFGLHRFLGKLSYFLIPFIVFFTLMVMKIQYMKGVQEKWPEAFNLAFLYLPAAALIPFVILYILAIINRKKTKYHMRYMIATAIALLGPGIGRINFGIQDMTHAIMFAFALSDLFLIGLLVFEYFKNKIYKPYLISLAICLFFHGIYPFFPSTNIWQFLASKFVVWF
ncbi:MAG: hypothetical protein ABI359_11840 [Ginsengibacter sp.]